MMATEPEYVIQERKRTVLGGTLTPIRILASVMLLGILSGFLVPDPKTAISIAATVAIGLTLLLYRRRMAASIAIAASVAACVNVVSPHIYVADTASLGGFSVFSWLAWTVSLAILGELHLRYRWQGRWVAMPLLYLAALLTIEYVGYHLLNIRLAGNEPSYLGLGVLHGTPTLHIVYTLAGPLYLLIIERLRGRPAAQ